MATTITGGLDWTAFAATTLVPPVYDGGTGQGMSIVFAPTGAAIIKVPLGSSGATATAYPGSTDPGASNVLSTTSYWFGGTQKTGSYVVPANAGVSSKVNYGVSGGTAGGLAASKIMDVTYGTLSANSVLSTAGGNYVLPPQSSVISSQSYGVNSGTNGTYLINNVVSGNIVQGVVIGGVTGNQCVPAAANVLSGVNTGTTTGTLAVPSPGNVLSGVSTDNTTGTLALPTASQVLVGVSYGVGGNGSTGTYLQPPRIASAP